MSRLLSMGLMILALLTLSSCGFFFGNEEEKVDLDSNIKIMDFETGEEVDRHDIEIGKDYLLELEIEANTQNDDPDSEHIIDVGIQIGTFDDKEKLSVIDSKIDDSRMKSDTDNESRYEGQMTISAAETETVMAEIRFRIDDMPEESNSDDQSIVVDYDTSDEGVKIYHDDFSKPMSPRERGMTINKGKLEKPDVRRIDDTNKITWDEVDHAESYGLIVNGEFVDSFDEDELRQGNTMTLNMDEYDYEETVEVVIVAEETETYNSANSDPLDFEVLKVY